jgi:hypothetical protein
MKAVDFVLLRLFGPSESWIDQFQVVAFPGSWGRTSPQCAAFFWKYRTEAHAVR